MGHPNPQKFEFSPSRRIPTTLKTSIKLEHRTQHKARSLHVTEQQYKTSKHMFRKPCLSA